MSKKCFKEDRCENKGTLLGLGNCCCDFPTLIILILIILQFNKRRHFGLPSPVASVDECGAPAPVAPVGYFGDFNLIDNSILFIIALFFLSCCNPCRK